MGMLLSAVSFYGNGGVKFEDRVTNLTEGLY